MRFVVVHDALRGRSIFIPSVEVFLFALLFEFFNTGASSLFFLFQLICQLLLASFRNPLLVPVLIDYLSRPGYALAR